MLLVSMSRLVEEDAVEVFHYYGFHSSSSFLVYNFKPCWCGNPELIVVEVVLVLLPPGEQATFRDQMSGRRVDISGQLQFREDLFF